MSNANTVQFAPPRTRMEADLTAAIEQDAAQSRADARHVEAMTRVRSEAEQREYRDRIEQAVNAAELLKAEPPDATALKISTDGLPEQRARLCRYVAWVASLQAELELIEAGRSAYLTSIGAVSMTENAVSELVESDRTSFLAWLKSGGGGLTKPQLRSFERERLEANLPTQRHEREVALSAVADAEFAIDVLTRQITVLDSRHQAFIESAVVEHADQTIGPEYRLRLAAVAEALTDLYGLATITKRGNNSASDARLYRGSDLHTSIEMPWFGLKSVADGSSRSPEIEVTETAVAKAAEPWKALAAAWRDNPRSDPPAAEA